MTIGTAVDFPGLVARLGGRRNGNGGWKAPCPVPGHGKGNGDRNPSLSIRESANGILLHCHAGCATENVLGALGLTFADIGTARGGATGRELVATYTYTDDAGHPVFYRDRFEWYDGGKRQKELLPRSLDGKRKGAPDVPYRLPALKAAASTGATVLLVEGEKPADVLAENGFVATTTGSSTSWKKKFAEHFRGARVVLWPDADAPGETYIANVARDVGSLVAELRVLRFSDKAKGWDAADFFAEGGTSDQLDQLLADAPHYAEVRSSTSPRVEVRVAAVAATPAYTGPAASLDDACRLFQKWLWLPDTDPLFATLATIAANKLPGDPVWLGLVAPPSSAKTEILNATRLLPDIHHAATFTPASLLSGTPKKERAASSRGGLLREIGEFGILVCKDFTSVLSMRPDQKAESLAALREIYDGSWTRHIGTDGGQSLNWSGKLGLLFGVTPVMDSHHSVIGAMGERFLLCRLPEAGHEQAERALEHSGAATAIMRRELAEIVAAVFLGQRPEPRATNDEERAELVRIASLAVRLRSQVERDRQSREIEAIHGAEGPARLVLSLERLLAGLDTLGCERDRALRIVRRVALDSVPPLRRRAFDWLSTRTVPVETKAVAEALGLPTNTVRRILEDLAAYRLVQRQGQGQGQSDLWIREGGA